MSTALDVILSQADLAAQSPYLSGHHAMSVDAVAGTDAAEERAQRHLVTVGHLVSRALANQTTADNVGLLGVSPASAPRVAAEAPVLAALATPLGPAPGKPTLPTWPTVTPVLDAPEKTVISSPVVGSDDRPAVVHTAAAAVNVSRQVADWSLSGFTLDAVLSASVLAKLETALLADLAAAGQPATDLAAALSACQPGATAIIGSMAALVALSSELAELGQAGLRPEVIPSPNATETLVVSMPAAVMATSSVRIGTQVEPGILGIGVAAYVYGYSGSSVTTAVQTVA